MNDAASPIVSCLLSIFNWTQRPPPNQSHQTQSTIDDLIYYLFCCDTVEVGNWIPVNTRVRVIPVVEGRYCGLRVCNSQLWSKKFVKRARLIYWVHCARIAYCVCESNPPKWKRGGRKTRSDYDNVFLTSKIRIDFTTAEKSDVNDYMCISRGIRFFPITYAWLRCVALLQHDVKFVCM